MPLDSDLPDLEVPIDLRIEGPVATMTLNRPDARNAMDASMLERFGVVLDQLESNEDVRVVILTGAGHLAFCAGFDHDERHAMSSAEIKAFFAGLRTACKRLARLPMAVIAAINGFAVGLGTELAACADVRIAAQSATLGLTDVRLAVVPGAGGAQRVARLIGVARAKEIIMTGRRISARDAQALGLVNDVVIDDELKHTSRQWAEEFLSAAPLAVAQAKRVIDKGINMPLDDALELEAKEFDRLLGTDDRVEAIAAFNEKRNSNFQGS